MKTTRSMKCPSCGHVDWRQAPKLKKYYDFVIERVVMDEAPTTSADIRARFKINRPNSSHVLEKLRGLGLVRRVRRQDMKQTAYSYLPTEHGLLHQS